MSLPSELIRETRMPLHLALNWFRQHWRAMVGLQTGLLLVIWLVIHPHDHGWLQAVRRQPLMLAPGKALALAGWLSHWGDFPGFNMMLGLGLWVAGMIWRKPRWKRFALMTLLCAAGISADILRFGLGRSRPHVPVPDAFYGPRFDNHYQSCPSGHTSTAFGASIPLLIAAPPLGVATTLVACSIGWSRMFVNRHYPADVAMGIWMALWFALPLGFAARIRRISDEPTTLPP